MGIHSQDQSIEIFLFFIHYFKTYSMDPNGLIPQQLLDDRISEYLSPTLWTCLGDYVTNQSLAATWQGVSVYYDARECLSVTLRMSA